MTNAGRDIKHPKLRGEWAEMRFMTRATEQGLTVTKPLGESARYDFVVDHGGCLLRIQVKATTARQYGSYTCNLRTGLGRTYAANEIDFVAAYVIPVDVWYILPAEITINYRSNIILSPHLENSRHGRYKEAWHLLREKRCATRPADLCFRRGCTARVEHEPEPITDAAPGPTSTTLSS